MIILIRGHIRSGFDNDRLYNFVRALYQKYNIELYIQTWNVFSNNLSWRPMKVNSTIVDEVVLQTYFRDVPIKQALILDDSVIPLIGDLTGVVMSSLIPTIGWKNMWYGKFKAAELIKDLDTNVINTRFDLFSNSNNFNERALLSFIDQNASVRIPYISFVVNSAINGIDNIYISTAAANYSLSKHFYENLDSMIHYKTYIHPEHAVFLEARRLFGSPPLQQQKQQQRPRYPSMQ